MWHELDGSFTQFQNLLDLFAVEQRSFRKKIIIENMSASQFELANAKLHIPKSFSEFSIVGRLGPQSQSEEGLSDGQYNTADLFLKFKLLSNQCKDLSSNKLAG